MVAVALVVVIGKSWTTLPHNNKEVLIPFIHSFIHARYSQRCWPQQTCISDTRLFKNSLFFFLFLCWSTLAGSRKKVQCSLPTKHLNKFRFIVFVFVLYLHETTDNQTSQPPLRRFVLFFFLDLYHLKTDPASMHAVTSTSTGFNLLSAVHYLHHFAQTSPHLYFVVASSSSICQSCNSSTFCMNANTPAPRAVGSSHTQ